MKSFVLFIFVCSSAIAYPRIGGKPAQNVEPGKAPFIVSLQFCVGGVCESDCTGVVLSENLVLTSATCASGIYWHIVVGATNLPDDNGQALHNQVAEMWLHPKFVRGKIHDNIAVMKLVKPLELGPKAQAVTLPKQGETPSSDLAEFYGYNERVLPKGPLSVSRNQKIVSTEECKNLIKKSNEPDMEVDHLICTASASTTPGDQGGPLIQNGILIGIASSSTADDRTESGVAVFTPTNEYVDWINEIKKSFK